MSESAIALAAMQLEHGRRQGTTRYRRLKATGTSETQVRQVGENSLHWWRDSRFLRVRVSVDVERAGQMA